MGHLLGQPQVTRCDNILTKLQPACCISKQTRLNTSSSFYSTAETLPLWVVCFVVYFVGNEDPLAQEWAGARVSGKYGDGVPLHAEVVSSLRSNVAKPLPRSNRMCASMKHLQTKC